MWDITSRHRLQGLLLHEVFLSVSQSIDLAQAVSTRQSNQTRRTKTSSNAPSESRKFPPQLKTTQGGLLGGKQKRRHSSQAHRRAHSRKDIMCILLMPTRATAHVTGCLYCFHDGLEPVGYVDNFPLPSAVEFLVGHGVRDEDRCRSFLWTLFSVSCMNLHESRFEHCLWWWNKHVSPRCLWPFPLPLPLPLHFPWALN